jgi:hypothetical protein
MTSADAETQSVQAEGQASDKDAIARAEAFGVDISLLKSNLRLTPTERVLRLQRLLDSIHAIQVEARAWRERERDSA